MSGLSNSEKFIKNLIGFVETKIELLKLDVREEISKVLAKLIAIIVLLLLCFLMIIFLSLALGNYLNDILESSFLGYLIVAAVYLILIAIMNFLKNSGSFKKMIDKQVKKMVSKNGE
ncbi:phage holin family protein [Fulvivirgaceae bacterium BMA10]|uniref:Phage holin family protein n=1 Tax=Splendidivirga corallicola TaxID=3051826 RepID=A0ABT8KUW3_9BACT|nr:phage holin family protein [Fulvivirgaceae bacterium BMA10]